MRLSAEPLEPRDTPTTLPPGFTESPVVTGLSEPTAMALAPDGRLFVTEQDGAVRVVQNGQLLATPFVSVPVDSTGERGLLGIALDPAFPTNNLVYVYYTVPAAADGPVNRISRFTANGNVAVPGSEQVLVTLDPLSGATNHNGGGLHFGPDGKLYVGVGENANGANAQSLTTRLGKILRYNPDGSIPADNPTAFAGLPGTTTGANRAIWAVGLRNPFTFDIQPGTGRVFINDVGASSFEEVDEGAAGRNFGWPATEGDFDTNPSPPRFPNFTRPLVSIPHGSGNDKGIAIAGAAFYNPATATFPADYLGDYFFGDLVNRWIKRVDPTTGTVTSFATDLTTGMLVDLDVTPQGDLLYLARGANGAAGEGVVSRISFPRPPQITTQPASAIVRPGQPATFAVTAGGVAPLTYQWQRNGTDIPGATNPTFTLPNAQPSDSGSRFRVVVTNGFGSVTSTEASLTVSETAPSPPPPIAVGSGPGRLPVVQTIDPVTGIVSAQFDLRTAPVSEPGFTGETRVATADVTGDGTPDLVVGAGPGGPSFVVVYDGKSRAVITARAVFEASFTGGVYVAAGDIDGDGKADVIVTPDQGGGPRVLVFRSPDGGVVADFFGIDDPNFRGGARAAVGDVNADGRADVIVAAGFGGGPRVAGWDGKQLAAGQRVRAFADFFAFEDTLRNGVFVAAGDVNGDGKADLVFGGGPGGGPRVLVLNGPDRQAVLGNFFAGDDASRDGVRVAAKDIDGDGKADVVAGLAGRVRGYRGVTLPTAGTPAATKDLPAFNDGFTGAVFVG